MAFASPASVANEELAKLRKFTKPLAAIRWAISLLSWGNNPPGRPSSAIMRIPISNPPPVVSRMAVKTSKVKRKRFSKEPPYSSVRWFTKGVQNWSTRWLVAQSSTPSSPAICARRAAAAKSLATRRKSAFSISLGQPRCIGSRTDDGPMVGSQSPS